MADYYQYRQQIQIMENRLSYRSREFTSPDHTMQKKFPNGPQICSPKFTRKRLQTTNMYSRKCEKMPDLSEPMTYISPKKYIDQQHSTTESVRSFNSITNFSRCENKMKDSGVVLVGGGPTDRDSISSISTGDLKAVTEMRVFETAEEIRSKVRANEEINQIKMANQGLNKKIIELNQRIKSLREQNNYLYRKIQGFNEVIGQKNQIINQFSQVLRDKQQSIGHFELELQHYKKKYEQQEATIAAMNKTLQQTSQKCISSLTDQTDDDNKQPSSCQQLQNYKQQLEQLHSKLKYFQIQSCMYDKLRYDLKTQVDKNQTLKIQNKKLIARVEYLVAHGGKENGFGRGGREGCVKVGRSRRESEISLELSPDR